MATNTKTLGQEITNRWLRLLAVALLTAGIMSLLIYAPQTLMMNLVRFVMIVAICAIIGLDTGRTRLGSFKAVVYFGAVSLGILITAIVDAVRHPSETLFLIKASDGEVSIQIAPVILLAALMTLFIIVGVITYKIGQRRGDVRGVKKEDLFK
jgi:hypothetical protein